MVGMFRTPSPKDSLSVALRKLFQGGRSRSQAIYKFATKGASSLNIKYQVSRNLAFYAWEDGSLWAHQNYSFHMYLSYLGPILLPFSPCFSCSPSSSATTMGWWQHGHLMQRVDSLEKADAGRDWGKRDDRG